MKKVRIITSILLLLLLPGCGHKSRLENECIKLEWTKFDEGWKITSLHLIAEQGEQPWGNPDGVYNILFSEEKPNSDAPVEIIQSNGDTVNFPISSLNLPQNVRDATTAVPMNRAGEKFEFYPETSEYNEHSITFRKKMTLGEFSAMWSLDEQYPSDVLVKSTFVAAKKGYYSLSSPSLAFLEREELNWGIVPGFYQGNRINDNFILSYFYAQGLPEFPVLCRESTITNPMAALTDKDSLTLAVIVEPGQDSRRYEQSTSLHNQRWQIALSHMDPQARLVPTAYHPVLGEEGSFCQVGDTLTFTYRFTLNKADWFKVYNHSVYDIYKFKNVFELKSSAMSLTDRVLSMYDYLIDNKTSQWKVEDYHGLKIGAQAYPAGAHGYKEGVMKNSDMGAVWTLSTLTNDPVLRETRLPYLRNFKVAQQRDTPGFFNGAAAGQYYVAEAKDFVEEWGNHFESIGLTYYTLIDIGNILLYEPGDSVLLNKLKAGAERLLTWQLPDGGWPVAFDRNSHQSIYKDLKDLRPTFYGMYVAYRLLHEPKYLDSAIKGADWFVKNAVENGAFIGVCGDARFCNDFATGQSAQALLDMYDLTGRKDYLDAAVRTARMYTTSIYTYPIPDRTVHNRGGKALEDWQLSQVGLSFEHGGAMGSAVIGGPILLASHAGMFVRMYSITGDSIFLDMARAGALGQDAFVNPKTHVASYYWKDFDWGSGIFPHHAWWQVGWILDYLVAEAELRSKAKISFPRGFVTPKVGPHQTVGFKQGMLNGEKASLILPRHFIRLDNSNVDYLLAETNKEIYLILLNQQSKENRVSWKIDFSSDIWKEYQVLVSSVQNRMLAPWGIEIIPLASKKYLSK